MPRGGKVSVYKPEFKQTAIELAMSSTKPITEIAREINVHPKTLHNWLYNHKRANNIVTIKTKSDEPNNELKEELKRLKKENSRLKMECDILKKATAYFAREVQ